MGMLLAGFVVGGIAGAAAALYFTGALGNVALKLVAAFTSLERTVETRLTAIEAALKNAKL